VYSTSIYGGKLDPYRSVRTAHGIKGNRQSIVVTNNPSKIDANQILTILFPNLGANDVIVPSTVRIAFNITLNGGEDDNCIVVNNLGRSVVKISVKLEGNEVLCLDDANIFLCYKDLWKTEKERMNAIYYGIQTVNIGKIRMGAGNTVAATQTNASIARAFGNRFAIPLDFEILTEHGAVLPGGAERQAVPRAYVQRLGSVITSSDSEATYQIRNISLEYDIVAHPDLGRLMCKQYMSSS